MTKVPEVTKVTVVGGGSAQWVPTLVEDFANTPSLDPLDLVLFDLDAARVERTGAHARHVAEVTGRRWRVEATTGRAEALTGADFVVVCISTGGLVSMGADLALAARHGLPTPIGDTIGPAGISRAWRNVPVLVDLAREMEARCPGAWLVNVTNPLTVLTGAVLKETAVPAVGLCHEVTTTQFFLSQLLDCGLFDMEVTVSGVNHLPLLTSVRVDGQDRWSQLLDVAHGRTDLSAPLPLLDQVLDDPPLTTGGAGKPMAAPGGWTKGALRDHLGLNFEILRRFGALPGAHPDHTCEFFGAMAGDAGHLRRRWGIDPVTVEQRAARQLRYEAELERKTADPEVTRFRSMEMVAPVLDGLLGGAGCVLPLNVANAGQCPDLPEGAVVESICAVDRTGVVGRDRARLPPVLAEWARRVAAAQEATLEAACCGDSEALLGALFLDPAAARLDYDAVVALRDDLVRTNRPWRSGGGGTAG